MNNDLIKAIDSVEKINKDKTLKEEYPKNKDDINHDGFDVLLKDEMNKLKQQKQELEQDKKYINTLLDIYNKENRNKNL